MTNLIRVDSESGRDIVYSQYLKIKKFYKNIKGYSISFINARYPYINIQFHGVSGECLINVNMTGIQAIDNSRLI